MKLTVLGSGSRGNAFALTTSGVTLLIDAGFGPKVLQRRADAADVSLDRVVGVVLTHEHGDHSRGAARFARRHECGIYASSGTLQALTGKLGDASIIPLTPHQRTTVGPFTVTPCPTIHDAAQPLALSVAGPAGSGKVGFAYDLGRATQAVRYTLGGSSCLVVEANHDEVMLRTADYPATVRSRIASSMGHLSNRAAGDLVAELHHTGLRHVVLAHLSEQCNCPDLAATTVRRRLDAVGYRGEVLVARQDGPLETILVTAEVGQLDLGLTA